MDLLSDYSGDFIAFQQFLKSLHRSSVLLVDLDIPKQTKSDIYFVANQPSIQTGARLTVKKLFSQNYLTCFDVYRYLYNLSIYVLGMESSLIRLRHYLKFKVNCMTKNILLNFCQIKLIYHCFL